MTSRTALRLVAISVALIALTAATVMLARRAGADAIPAPAASTAVPPLPSDPKAAALFACERRAEYLFVKRCRQSCRADERGKDLAKAMQCVERCGTQPERPLFVQDCVARAGTDLSDPRA